MAKQSQVRADQAGGGGRLQSQPASAHRRGAVHVGDILYRQRRGDILLVGRRKRMLVAAFELGRLALGVTGAQRHPQSIAPGNQRGVEFAFQRAPVDGRRAALADAHRDVQLRQRRVADRERRIELAAAERAPQHVLYAAERVVVEALARQVHEAGPEAAQLIAAQDQADSTRLIVQRENRACAACELADRGLKQLIARQVVEDLTSRLLSWLDGRKGERGDHARHLEPHQRHGARIGVVGVRGP